MIGLQEMWDLNSFLWPLFMYYEKVIKTIDISVLFIMKKTIKQLIFQYGRRSPSILWLCANTRPKGGDNPFAEEIRWLLCCHGKHQHQHKYQDQHYNFQMHEKLQYNPVKMYLTSIVIDPLPQLASLGQLEGYIQVGRHHLQRFSKTIIIAVWSASDLGASIFVRRVSGETDGWTHQYWAASKTCVEIKTWCWQ